MKPQECLEEAIRLSQKALELDPANPRACATLGRVFLKAGKPGEAIPYLEKALQGPQADEAQSADLNLCLGRAYCSAGLIDKAQARFAKAVRPADAAPLTEFLAAARLLALGQYEPAAAGFLRAAEPDPHFAGATSALACAYAWLGRYESAAEAFDKSASSDCGGAFDYCGAAACMLAIDSRDEAALVILEKPASAPAQSVTPLERRPADPGAFLQELCEGRALLARGTADEAGFRDSRRAVDWLILQVCETIVSKLAGKNSPLRMPRLLPHYLVCAAYAGLGRHDQAVEACRRILEADPADPLALRQLFESNQSLGNPLQAADCYKDMLSRDANNIDLALKLVDIYMEAGNMDLALTYCHKALGIDPDNLQANHVAGLVLMRKERPFAALPHLQKAAKLEEGNAATLLALGEAYSQVREPAAARSAWEKVSASDPHGEWGRKARAQLKALKKAKPEAAPPPPAQDEGAEPGGPEDAR